MSMYIFNSQAQLTVSDRLPEMEKVSHEGSWELPAALPALIWTWANKGKIENSTHKGQHPRYSCCEAPTLTTTHTCHPWMLVMQQDLFWGWQTTNKDLKRSLCLENKTFSALNLIKTQMSKYWSRYNSMVFQFSYPILKSRLFLIKCQCPFKTEKCEYEHSSCNKCVTTMVLWWKLHFLQP